jgi:HD-GYP domain-containing protein (c-di-GMP phosphodiesterase class II)
MIEEAAKIVSCFVSGMTDYADHPADPRSISRYAEEALGVIKSLHIEHFFTITMGEDNSLLINGVEMPLNTPDARKFFIKLGQKRVATIVISKGVQAGEIKRLISDLASSGGSFHSYAHIAVKRGAELPRGDIFLPGRSRKNDFLQIKLIHRDISAEGRIDMTAVDEVVGHLIADVRKGGKLPVYIREESDELHVHSAKVAILSILQGEYLGLGNALLYDIGLSALLHDIGKTLLPQTLLDKQDSLNEAEWTMMKNHPVYGAALLASLNGVPEIAVIVAYEHHRRHDGTGYPETGRISRKQHVISQIVAIADFYCAMSTRLPHREPVSNTSILGLLIETAGTQFNPLLVDNFVRIMDSFSPA